MIAAALDWKRCLNRKSSSFLRRAGSTTKLRNGFALGMTDYTHSFAVGCNSDIGYNGDMEHWKQVPGFPSYEVSDEGRIRRIDGTSIKPFEWKSGYQCQREYQRVTVQQRGKRLRTTMHRLVLTAFCGPCPEGKEAAHLDGNPRNNSLANLAWATPEENRLHRLLHGRIPRGERAGVAKLTRDQVIELRGAAVLRRCGRYIKIMNRQDLVSKFRLSPNTVSAIVKGQAWRHLPIPYLNFLVEHEKEQG